MKYSCFILLLLNLNAIAQPAWLSVQGGVTSGGGGIPIHTNLVGGNQTAVEMTITTVRDGIIYAWVDNRPATAGTDIYAQKLDPCGNIAPNWPSTGLLICNASGNQNNIVILPDESDGAIIIWEDDRVSAAQQDIYAQKVNGNGTVSWATNGIPVNTESRSQGSIRACTDRTGGAIITWHDNRVGTTGRNIYAQRIKNSGVLAWTPSGVPIAVQNGNQQFPDLVEDSLGGAVIVWEDNRPISNNLDIYGERLDSNGLIQWGAPLSGIIVSNLINAQRYPKIANNGGNFFTIAFENQGQIWAKRVDGNGSPAPGWNISGNPGFSFGVGLNTNSTSDMVVDSVGDVYLPYHANDSWDVGVYSNRFSSNPTPPLAHFAHNPWGAERNSRISVDVNGGGGKIGTVYDHTNNAPTNVFCRFTNPNSNILVSQISPGNKNNPAIAAMGNNFYFAWEDRRTAANNVDIYAAATDTLAAPAKLVISKPAPYCIGDTLIFTTTQPSGLFNNFDFYVDGILVQSGTNNYYSTSTLSSGSHNINVTAYTSSGCATRSSNTINLDVINCTLPIELLSFNANKQNEEVKLTWHTVTEINNAFFTIERSNDLINNNWKIIGKVAGAGNSSQLLYYELYDKSPQIGTNYYRLKQTDFDINHFSYSDIKVVNFSKENEVNIYPIPTRDYITIEFNQNSDNTYITITDMLGKIVFDRKKIITDRTVYNLSQKANGIYFINVFTDTSLNKQFKIIKQ